MNTTEKALAALRATRRARRLVRALESELFALQSREAVGALLELQKAEAQLITLHALRVPAEAERAA